MNKKQIIRLTENQFHQIVKETVKRVLNEQRINDDTYHLHEEFISHYPETEADRKRAAEKFGAAVGQWFMEQKTKETKKALQQCVEEMEQRGDFIFHPEFSLETSEKGSPEWAVRLPQDEVKMCNDPDVFENNFKPFDKMMRYYGFRLKTDPTTGEKYWFHFGRQNRGSF